VLRSCSLTRSCHCHCRAAQAVQQAEAAAAAGQAQLAAQRDGEAQLQQECINLQRALQDSMRKVQVRRLASWAGWVF
jgi:hypothetical protein